MKTAMTYGELRRELDDAANAAAADTGCEPNEVKVVGWVSESDELPDTHGISHIELIGFRTDGVSDRTDVIAVVFRGTVDWPSMRWIEPEEVAS